MRGSRLLLLITILIIHLVASASLDDRVYLRFTKENGLPSNRIYNLDIDKYGRLWMGTDAGVCSFNGMRFENYTTSDGLPSPDIIGIKADQEGRVWFKAFERNISYFKNGKIFGSHNTPALEGINADVFHNSFYLTEDGVWIQGSSAYYFYSHDTIKVFPRPQYDIFFEDNDISSFYYSNDSGPVLHNKFGIYTIRNGMPLYKHCWGGEEVIITWAIGDSILIQRESAISLYYQGKEKVLYKSTDEGLKKLLLIMKDDGKIWLRDLDGGLCYLVEKDGQYHLERSLVYENVSDVLADPSGNIWVSTLDNGLLLFPKAGVKRHYISDTLNIKGYHYNSAINTQYIGFERGKLKVLGPNIDSLYNTNCRQTPAVNNIQHLTMGFQLWVGSGCVFGYFDENTFNYAKTNKQHSTGAVKSLVQKGDTLFIGSAAGLIYYLADHSSMPIKINSDRVIDLTLDNNGDLLVATTKTIYKYPNTHQPLVTFTGETMPVAMAYLNSRIVLATASEGVFVINNDSITKIAESSGATSNICFALVAENDSTFWYSTSKGVTRAIFRNMDSIALFHYSMEMGLTDETFTQLKIFSDTLYMVGNNSILKLATKQSYQAPLIVLKISTNILGNDSILINPNIKLEHDHKPLIVKLEAIELNSLYNIKYWYKMDEEEEWLSLEEPKLSLFALSPGTYNLYFKASTTNGGLSGIVPLLIVVNTPYWRSFSFYLGVFIVTLLVLFMVSALIIKRVKRIEEEKTRYNSKIALSELRALQAQMNPHFIYNALYSIQGYIMNNKKELASNYLMRFSSLMRSTLNSSRARDIPLTEEIDLLKSYLELEHLRSNGSFEYHITISENLRVEEVFIPPMFIQPLVENAIKHGVEGMIDGTGIIELLFQEIGNNILVTVKDNGKGIANKERTNSTGGHSSDIITDRIKNYNTLEGYNITLEINRKKDPEVGENWTVVELKLPMLD